MMERLLLAGILACVLVGGAWAENDIGKAARTSLGQPFWSTKTMTNEPVLFIQDQGQPVASGKLLFIPSVNPVLTHPDLRMRYVEGKDYIWKTGSDTIELTAFSRIPFKTPAQMNPPSGSPNSRDGVLWSESHFFHDLQVQVTYEHDETWAWQPPPQSQPLTRSLAALRAKKGFKIVALGDSITEGFNASGKIWAPPYQPCYAQLVANTLHQRFGASVTLVNLGIAGTRTSNGLTQIAKLQSEKPDLVLIAYGMNHQEAAPAFKEAVRELLAAVQTAAPGADVILIAPMTGNPRIFPPERFVGYRDVLRDLTMPNVALADVTSPWFELLKRKPFSDLSGNNVNHPNDFGHRLYAQIVCQLFPLTTERNPQ